MLRVPSPSAPIAQAGAKLALPFLLTCSPTHCFCLTCCSSLWEEHSLQLACIPDHLGCRGYPGWRGSSWVNSRALCGLEPSRGRGRRTSAEVGGTGKSAQSPEERMAVPQSGSGDSSIFSKASCRYSKYTGLVHTGTGALDFVELASQRGLWERVHE